MFRPSEFRDLISGRRRGVVPAVLRCLLRGAEVPYSAAVRWRNGRFDSGARPMIGVDVPVVSVGNLTLGGTGKTPTIEWIAQWFRRRDIRVALISRGYGSGSGDVNDEALELARSLPGVPHLQNPDRVTAAQQIVDRYDSQVILLDDAFQHRRIHRDLDIVLLDAFEPFGFGHVFPRGTLREPVDGLRRADIVFLTRADKLDATERESIRNEVARLAPNVDWVEVTHEPRVLLCADGREESLESLTARPVAAFCGIGNPAGFRHTLSTLGVRIVAFREFADHHPYGPTEIASLADWASDLDVSAVVCTRKDLVKLDLDQLGPHPLRAVKVGLRFLTGEERIETRLVCLLEERLSEEWEFRL